MEAFSWISSWALSPGLREPTPVVMNYLIVGVLHLLALNGFFGGATSSGRECKPERSVEEGGFLRALTRVQIVYLMKMSKKPRYHDPTLCSDTKHCCLPGGFL